MRAGLLFCLSMRLPGAARPFSCRLSCAAVLFDFATIDGGAGAGASGQTSPRRDSTAGQDEPDWKTLSRCSVVAVRAGMRRRVLGGGRGSEVVRERGSWRPEAGSCPALRLLLVGGAFRRMGLLPSLAPALQTSNAKKSPKKLPATRRQRVGLSVSATALCACPYRGSMLQPACFALFDLTLHTRHTTLDTRHTTLDTHAH